MLSFELAFEWDVSKAEANFQKHGVSLLEAAETFYDPEGFQIMDEKHSLEEARVYWIGKSKAGRILTSWFTMRENKVRIIGSAELRKFRRLYESSETE